MMILKFTNFQLGDLTMRVPDEKVLEYTQSLITLGYDVTVEMETTDVKSDTVDV